MGAFDPRLSLRVAAAWRVILGDCDGELSGHDLYETHVRSCVIFGIDPVAVGTFKNLLARSVQDGLVARVGKVPGYKRSVWMSGVFSLTTAGEKYWDEHGAKDWGNGHEFTPPPGEDAGVGGRLAAVRERLNAGKAVKLTARDVGLLGLAADEPIVMKLDR